MTSTSQNCLHPIKLKEMTLQMSQERKLCNSAAIQHIQLICVTYIHMCLHIKDRGVAKKDNKTVQLKERYRVT